MVRSTCATGASGGPGGPGPAGGVGAGRTVAPGFFRTGLTTQWCRWLTPGVSHLHHWVVRPVLKKPGATVRPAPTPPAGPGPPGPPLAPVAQVDRTMAGPEHHRARNEVGRRDARIQRGVERLLGHRHIAGI